MEPSSQRNISEFAMGEPFEKGGLEFAVIKVKGQSFMLHQASRPFGKTSEPTTSLPGVPITIPCGSSVFRSAR